MQRTRGIIHSITDAADTARARARAPECVSTGRNESSRARAHRVGAARPRAPAPPGARALDAGAAHRRRRARVLVRRVAGAPSTRPYIEANWPRARAPTRGSTSRRARERGARARGRPRRARRRVGRRRARGRRARAHPARRPVRALRLPRHARRVRLRRERARRSPPSPRSAATSTRTRRSSALRHAAASSTPRTRACSGSGSTRRARADGCADAAVAAWFEVEQRAAGRPHEHADVVARFAPLAHRATRCSAAAERHERPMAAWPRATRRRRGRRSQSRATLHYRDGRGMGDVVRFLLEWAGAPLIEAPASQETLKEVRQGRRAQRAPRAHARAGATRARGRLFGQVPMLELDARARHADGRDRALRRAPPRPRGMADCEREATRADVLLQRRARRALAAHHRAVGDEPDRALEQFSARRRCRGCSTRPRARSPSTAARAAEGADLFVAGGARATYADVALLDLDARHGARRASERARRRAPSRRGRASRGSSRRSPSSRASRRSSRASAASPPPTTRSWPRLRDLRGPPPAAAAGVVARGQF